MNQKSSNQFDSYKDNYSSEINNALAFAGKNHDFFIKAKADNIINLLRKNFGQVKRKIKILDVGCGHGLIHRFLIDNEDLNVELTGIDIASEVIEQARIENPKNLYDVYDGKSLPYQNASFDFIFAIGVLHHVDVSLWGQFVAEMKRVLKPDGVVAIFEHNPYNPLTQKVVRSCPIDDDAILLSANKTNKLMKVAGFQSMQTNYILFTPFAGSFFKWLDRKLYWLPLGAQYCVSALNK